jgi:hypothetical protein
VRRRSAVVFAGARERTKPALGRGRVLAVKGRGWSRAEPREGAVMFCRCLRWVLIVVGVALLTATFLPVFVMLPISEDVQTGLVAAKFLMLPAGAFCLAGAAALSAKLHRR